MKAEIPICYACDDGFVMQMGISISSLFEVHKNIINTPIYFLACGVSAQNVEMLANIARKYSQSFNVIDVGDKLASMAKKYSLKTYGETKSFGTYARLFMADLLPNFIDTILYVDCDTVINDDLSDVLKIDLSALACGMVSDTVSGIFKNRNGFNAGTCYCNAGIMLANLKFWRDNNSSDALWKYFLSGNMNLPDQNAFNAVFENLIYKLPLKYNVSSRVLALSEAEILRLCRGSTYYSQDEIRSAKQNPAIIHYVSDALGRPWELDCKLKSKGPWNSYFERSPWCQIEKTNGRMSREIKIERYIHLYFGGKARTEFLILWERLRFFAWKMMKKASR